MRTFIALELPAAFEEGVAGVARVLKTAVEGRFMGRETYHLTLAFMGEIGEAEAQQAIAALDAACAGLAPVSLAPEGLGKFGRASDATLWLGIAPDPALIELAQRVREELRQAGISFDEKPFRPHITLARRARLPKDALPQLAFPASAQADTATLFKSTLSHEGASYKPLYSVTVVQSPRGFVPPKTPDVGRL